MKKPWPGLAHLIPDHYQPGDFRVRGVSLWIPTATMLLVSFISYVDRNTLALLAPTILEETGLSAEQYGFIISAFSIAYMIGNPLWGRLLDQWGLKRGMNVAVSLWTMASAAHALVGGFLGFATARAALGFGEGATFPGGLRAAMQTLPASKRSRGIAVAYSGGSLGAIITPIIITPIALIWGWRAAFLFTGLIGLCWLLLWFFVSRRPDVSQSPAVSETKAAGGDMRFNDPRIWSFGVLYAGGALPIAFVIYGASYLPQQSTGRQPVCLLDKSFGYLRSAGSWATSFGGGWPIEPLGILMDASGLFGGLLTAVAFLSLLTGHDSVAAFFGSGDVGIVPGDVLRRRIHYPVDRICHGCVFGPLCRFDIRSRSGSLVCHPWRWSCRFSAACLIWNAMMPHSFWRPSAP